MKFKQFIILAVLTISNMQVRAAEQEASPKYAILQLAKAIRDADVETIETLLSQENIDIIDQEIPRGFFGETSRPLVQALVRSNEINCIKRNYPAASIITALLQFNPELDFFDSTTLRATPFSYVYYSPFKKELLLPLLINAHQKRVVSLLGQSPADCLPRDIQLLIGSFWFVGRKPLPPSVSHAQLIEKTRLADHQSVKSVSWSPDGRLLASGSGDTTRSENPHSYDEMIKIWNHPAQGVNYRNGTIEESD